MVDFCENSWVKLLSKSYQNFRSKYLLLQKRQHFFWSNPKSQLHKVILMCGKHTHVMFHVVSFFLCWIVVLWHFLEVFVIYCSFSSFFRHGMLWRTCMHRLSCLSLWMLILTIHVVKLHFRGASQNPLQFLSWWEFFLESFVIYCSFSSIFRHWMLFRTCTDCLACLSEC